MRREALDHVRAAIEANTRRRTLDQLKAEGKRHVRVVSGEKILSIIQAIVGDIVDREVGEVSKQDRERIVSESKAQFDRVMKIQAEQDALLAEQKNLVAEYKEKLERLQELHEAAVEEHSRAERRMQAEFQARVEDLTKEGGASAKRLAELETRLATSKTTIENYDSEISRLTHRINEDGDLLEELKAALQARELEAQRFAGERDALATQLAALKEHAGETEAVAQLKDELAEMKSFLRTLGDSASRANDATVEALLAKLADRETFSTASLEERFQATLDKSLDQISRTMAAATAKPIDIAVEATDALIAKIFDAGDAASTNLDDLEVVEQKSKAGIAGNLARLRALKAAGAGGKSPEPEGAAPAETARKARESVERLKAVRAKQEKKE
jgi:chromosome segregation ATPase